MDGERTQRLIARLALALLVGALVVVLRPPSLDYLDLLRRGDAHAAAAERTAAVALYREATSLRPDDPLPYLCLARVYLDWGRADEALSALDEAEWRGADELALLRPRIAAYTALEDWPAVVENARRLLSRAPEDREARHALARAHVNLRQWDEARAAYRALLRADPADQEARERLGALLLGDDDAAAVQHLFAAGTDLSENLLLVLEESLPLENPAYTSVLLGREFLAAGEWALAVRQFEWARRGNPDYPEAYAYLGYALDQLGHPGEAGPYLREAVALMPSSAVAHTFLGLHYERQGNLAAARAEYEAAYDLDPDNPAICIEIGQAWAAGRRYVAADIWLREAVALQPDDPALWETLARFYLDHTITSADRAVEATETLLELSPEDARAHDLRGWAAFQMGEYDAAERHLQQAIELDPHLASAYYHLGLLRSAQDAPEEAEEALIRALDLDTTGRLVPRIERALGELP